MTEEIGLTGTVAGITYNLNTTKIRLLDWDLGLSSISRLAQRIPNQLGDSDLGFRLEPRFVPLTFGIHGENTSEYRTLRATFLECFQPRANAPVSLVFDLGGGLKRAVDVHLDGELAWTDRVDFVERVGGLFKASDPRLYDPDIHTEEFNLASAGGSTGGWEIPWEIPWEIGADTLNMALTIEYAGLSRLGAPEYPVITVFGPINDPVITNETTGEVLDFTGLSLTDSSEWIRIDLNPLPFRDAKTVVDQDGNSASHWLSTDSDLATFHLAPAGEKLLDGSYASGENIIRVEGDGVTPETVVVMTYYDRYQGV